MVRDRSGEVFLQFTLNESQEFEPLLLIPAYVLDFLCIHPFRDGNGRMARLISYCCYIRLALQSDALSALRTLSKVHGKAITTRFMLLLKSGIKPSIRSFRGGNIFLG